MKSFLCILFCLASLKIAAQKNISACLKIIYPSHFSYDTIVVKDKYGNILEKRWSKKGKSKRSEIFILSIDSSGNSAFSIYFGGSETYVNDTLYFLSKGNNLTLAIGDSFALRNHIDLHLKNVFNFEELYNRYSKYCRVQMQRYDSLSKQNQKGLPAYQQYLINIGLNFVKRNLDNPYWVDLFANFVIAPQSGISFSQAHEFYLQHLKFKIADGRTKKFVESKIEKLRISVKEGSMSPVFIAHSITGKLLNSNLLSGQNILLIFWASWCGPCVKEAPVLKKIHDKYKSHNLVMISVSLDTDSIKMIDAIRKYELNWDQIFNDHNIIEQFRVNPIPHLFLIDEHGRIIFDSLEKNNTLNKLMQLLNDKFRQ